MDSRSARIVAMARSIKTTDDNVTETNRTQTSETSILSFSNQEMPECVTIKTAMIDPSSNVSYEIDIVSSHDQSKACCEVSSQQASCSSLKTPEDDLKETGSESSCADDSVKDPDYSSSSSSSSDSSSDSDSSESSSDSDSSDHSTNSSSPRHPIAEETLTGQNVESVTDQNVIQVPILDRPNNTEGDQPDMNNAHLQTDNEVITLTKRGKKRSAKPLEWIKNKNKKLRNTGQAYTSSSKTKRQLKARNMGPPCGAKCRLKCSSKINEEQRRLIFTRYWALNDVNKQRAFIAANMQRISPQDRNNDPQRRRLNNAFYFEIGEDRVRVCKLFFKTTLDINDRPIRTVIDKKESGFVEDDLRGKHGKHRKVNPEIKADIRRHIDSIPRIESHYLRAQTTREYIEGGKSLSDIYEDYKENCVSQNRPYGHRVMFSRIFNEEYNISFFSPKKDQCELCTAFQIAKDDEKENLKERFDQHQQEKILSRIEKSEDKEKVSDTHIVACYDLQAVLSCPKGEVSTFYYISKLNTFNFTICQLKSNTTKCYVWHEGEGKRGANEIGSCVFKFIEEKANAANSDDLELVFYSDNCCGQQKNRFIISMYMHAVQVLKVKSITHKFLIKGHSQNEGDNVHSVIEKKIRKSIKSGPIYVPDQYITIIRTARRVHPYEVVEMSHQDFLDMKDLSSQYGTNFSKDVSNNTVLMGDIKVVKVEKCRPFTFWCKTSYAETEYKEVLVKRVKRSNAGINDKVTVKPLYVSNLPIDIKKKNGLLGLFKDPQQDKTKQKNKKKDCVVPPYYYEYYKRL